MSGRREHRLPVGHAAPLERDHPLVPDDHAALETAIRLGFRRVLTSGGAVNAVEGAARIQKLVDEAAGRIEVMAGAGLTPENVTQFVRRTGVRAVHSSCSSAVQQADAVAAHACALGFTPEFHKATDPLKIAAMLRALNALA